jgi:hypothetical protein
VGLFHALVDRIGDMKCDGCGHEFPPGEAVLDTRNEPTGSPTALGQNTRTVHFVLCPQCAANRNEIRAMIFWPFAILFIIGLVLVLLSSVCMLPAF